MDEWRSLIITEDTPILRAIEVIDKTKMQIALVVGENGVLKGTVTDGDMRRGLLHGVAMTDPASTIMCANPTTARLGEDPENLRSLMSRKLLRQIPLLDAAGKLAGLATMLQLMQLETRIRDNLVVLMAGGRGERLRPLTLDCPKPMLPVGPRPILETIMDGFLRQGFHRFTISLNYLGEKIVEHFGDGSRFGAQISYLREDCPLGTAGALSLLPEPQELPVVVMNGDLLTKANFGNILAFHEEQGAAASMGVRTYEMQVPYGVAQVEGQRLLRLEEKPILTHFVNAGIYVLSAEALRRIPRGACLDMPELLNSLAAQELPVAVYPIREYWMDIGRLADYERANDDYSTHFS